MCNKFYRGDGPGAVPSCCPHPELLLTLAAGAGLGSWWLPLSAAAAKAGRKENCSLLLWFWAAWVVHPFEGREAAPGKGGLCKLALPCPAERRWGPRWPSQWWAGGAAPPGSPAQHGHAAQRERERELTLVPRKGWSGRSCQGNLVGSAGSVTKAAVSLCSP